MAKRRAEDEPSDWADVGGPGVVQQLDDKPCKTKPKYPIGFIINEDMRRQWSKAENDSKRRVEQKSRKPRKKRY